ncbi:MAG: tRNA (adenosine(37)-N6)-threonylcarbamoyltransferase complex dimerization subunit type 1 TsaB [Rhodospirillales bacterium]|nr:tRNA (adenosine(37)-N6)-threonylcarbamoyltransferase complex dimerization subunit type 1 TsaB [Rhodospirillales bacterium]
MSQQISEKDGAGPRILAIETSSRRGSIAMGLGDELLAFESFERNLRHAAELLPAMERATRRLGWTPQDLDQVYVSAGPGSFTGLRIGITVAKTLAQASGLQIVAVPSIAVIAGNAPDGAVNVGVVLDAKRKQVFAGRFQRRDGKLATSLPACLTDPRQFVTESPKPLLLLGEGIKYHGPALQACDVQIADESLFWPSARVVYRLGRELAGRGKFSNPATLTPIYLRMPEAVELWNARHGAKTGGN